MSTKIGNLWPQQLEDAIFATPLSILKEQASALGSQTKGLVEADVVTRKERDSQISHTFVLIAPALDNYRFALFTINHSISLYPIFVDSGAASGGLAGIMQTKLNDENEFVEWLRTVLNSERTKKMVGALISQSREMTDYL